MEEDSKKEGASFVWGEDGEDGDFAAGEKNSGVAVSSSGCFSGVWRAPEVLLVSAEVEVVG